MSCDETKTDTNEQTQSNTSLDQMRITSKATRKQQLTLTPEAQKFTKEWVLYTNLSKAIDSLRQPTVATIRSRAASLTALFTAQEQAEDAAVSSTPDTLDIPAINARLLVVETRVRLLKNLTSKTNVDTLSLRQELDGLHNAYQELNLQLNERFSKSIDQLLQEAQNTDTSAPQSTPFSPNF